MKNKNIFIFDIEGTVAPISFVHQILFPYSVENLESFLEDHGVPENIQNSLIQENRMDLANRLYSEEIKNVSETKKVFSYLKFLISVDRKSPSLKEIQGRIWESGYKSGKIKSSLFPDSVDFFKQLQKQQKKVFIYSSGSILAQKLIFTYSEFGDLTPYIHGYFDTGIGPKKETKSYENIIRSISCSSLESVFFTDIVDEAKAAIVAGIDAYILSRPGNIEQGEHSFPILPNFSNLF